MASGRNVLFPRSAVVPRSLAARIRRARQARGWTQREVAEAVGCARRTMIRLEAGSHRASSHLVHALEDVLGISQLVPGWMDAASLEDPSLGPRCHWARIVAGKSLADVAKAAGVSPATLSRFEREMGDTGRIVSALTETIVNEGLANALGFADAAGLNVYCMTSWSRDHLPDVASPD